MSIDLVTEVKNSLQSVNPAAASRFDEKFDSRATNDNPVGALNRFWRSALMDVKASTVSARSCLADDMAPEDWIRHFKRLVLPTIALHDLPK